MEHGGLDVHKMQTQVCRCTADGEIVEQRIATTRERFTAVFGGRARMRLLLEASTESEWVARCLESLGHEVIVGDPNFEAMYGTRERHVKTDRRDARALLDACRTGIYRPTHRVSDAQRAVRAELAAREAVVRTRTRLVSLIRSLVRREGFRLRACAPEALGRQLATLTLPAPLMATLAPLERLLAATSTEIAAADRALAARAAADPVATRLQTVPGVGPVTAVAFVAGLDDVTRFPSAAAVAAYLGLVPREHSSGESTHRGRITKAGSTRVRMCLVQAAHALLRTKGPAAEALRAWATRVAGRRGKRIAVVALARRLAGLLYALWRDGTVYQPARVGRPATPSAPAGAPILVGGASA